MKSILRVICSILMMNLMINSAGAGQSLSPKKGALSDLDALAKAQASYAQLPLYFEANRGQADASVKFVARGKGYTLFLTALEAVLALQAPASSKEQKIDVVRMSLKGANANPMVKGLDILPGQSNYLTGNDQQKWHTKVEQYTKVEYKQVYPGIDVVYYGNQGQLEYDFIVAPGANPGLIRMNFKGAKNLKLDKQGNLVLNFKERRLAFSAPLLYQKTGDTREPVEGRFVLAGNKQVCFNVGAYDKSKELVIDPSLTYSTYLGGTVEDRVNAIALDSSGNIYLAGLTVSAGFPGSTTAGVFNPGPPAGTDAFVIKLSTAGTVMWSTYLGGAGIDIANGIAVDGTGKVRVTGATTSTNFPTTQASSTAYQVANAGGTDAFVTAIKADGSGLDYSTYLGAPGVDEGNGIAVDAAGNAYVTGLTTVDSSHFPRTPGAYLAVGGMTDAFVAKFSPAGVIAYSTYLGGTGFDIGRAIAIDSIGNAYITGQAADAFFPTASYPNVFKPTITGSFDAFIAKLDPTGANLLYVTYVGGSGIDDAFGIALDGANPATLNVYITGYTFSADFPDIGFATVGQTTIGTAPDAYVFKLNMNGGGGHLDGVYSTYLGGSTDDRATAIKVDAAGNAYVTGHTSSGDFPMVQPIQGTLIGGGMVFVTEIGPTGATKVFSTYLGGVTDQSGNGIGLDSTGNIYVAGWTNSADFPTASSTLMPNITQVANAGGLYDGFVTKISGPLPVATSLPAITSVYPPGGISAGGTTVVITGSGFTGTTGVTGVKFGGTNATSYVVDSNTQITAIAPAHTSGIVHIVVTNSVGSSSIVPDDMYTYFSGSGNAPMITGLNPTLGSTAGGTTVIITGSEFTGVTGPNGVKFGTLNAASYVVNSNTQITAKTKAHAPGIVDVMVTSLSGSSPIGTADRYTYFLTATGNFDPYIFPSPTTGDTSGIAYYMAGPGLVNIRIYNEIGNLVYTLEESKPANAQGSRINVGKLAPGVYFYLLNIKYDDGTTKKYTVRKFAVTH